MPQRFYFISKAGFFSQFFAALAICNQSMSVTKSTLRTPPESVIQSVREAYYRGQTIDALKRATEFAPLQHWAGLSGCELACRIAGNTGGVRLALKLATRMWSTDKAHPLSQFEYGFQIEQWRGPLVFWLNSGKWPSMAGGTPESQGEFLALKSRVASDLRDFKVAEQLIGEAESLAPHGPWIRLQRAHLLERQEKMEEALEIASAACKLHPQPFYRPGVQTVAHYLQLMDRDEEAIGLLREADTHLQNAHLSGQLFGLFADTQQWLEAEQALERFSMLSPLIEPKAKLWLQGQQARVAYHLGKRTQAFEFANGLKDKFNQQFAQQLAQPAPTSEQIRLEVPFVRQHFKTCAPATLAALGRYWKMPGEHLALVEAICYDGTPAWQQRDWAERNGWLVREFRVTWETALELLSKEIPFAISTVEASSAHMQAVIGFDQTRSSLLLRDPSQPYCLEFQADTFLERYRPFGPRGMLFLPTTESDRLTSICLPDAEPYDEYHNLILALSKHDREKAQSGLARLQLKWPDHEITWSARLELAAYDANTAEEIRCLDRLLEIFPDNPARLLRRLHCMREAPREERVEFLERACANKTADPALFVELAKNLMADAPQQVAAERWLRRSFRRRPMDSNAMSALADLRWWLGRFDEGTELYRFAATVEGYREPMYQAWFNACRQVRQTDAALAHLEDRFRRLGHRSAQPALTLAWALREVEQPERARNVLTEAIQLRPDDGYLLIRAASLNARLGTGEQGESLLNSAKGKVRENDWLRAAAEIALLRFDIKGALKCYHLLLALEPLAVDAHGGVARSLAQLEGRAAAVAHLKEACAKYPHHCGLQRLFLEWSSGFSSESMIVAAQNFLKISPRDAWTRRELACVFANLNRMNEALVEAEEGFRIEPRNSYSVSLLGNIHEKMRHFPEARARFRQAIALSVDNGNAIAGLLRLANTDKERKEELVFLEQELVRQVVRGDGLIAFMEAARPILEAEALLKILRQAHSERPDLWHAWSALIRQLDHLGSYDEALSHAQKATERFSHMPKMWLELAMIHRRRKEAEAEISAAQRAFEINPGWNQSASVLAGALERHRSLSEALAVYERALRHAPTDSQLYVRMASIQWRLRQPKEALATVEKALRLAPEADWAWNPLITWSREYGQPERPMEVARELAQERPGDAHVWWVLARVLDGANQQDERSKALNRALELNPNYLEAWDFKAELLAGALQFDLAVKACEEGLANCPANAFMLRGRRAWIDAQCNKVPDAIRRMREVVAENAGYVWGWQQLVVWHLHEKAYSDAETAVRQLLKLQPQNAWAQRQLAVVRLRQGDKAGAQQVYSAVLEGSPTDELAAQNLFDLQLELGNLSGAAETLRRMQTHQPSARTLAREVILKTRSGDKSTALELFRQICTQPDPDPWPVQATTDALKKAGLTDRLLKTLKRVVVSDSCNPQAGAAAIQLLIDKKQGFRAMWLFGRIRSTEARTRAAAVLARGVSLLKARLSLRILLWRNREIFFKDDAAWGQIGYALTKFKRMGAAAKWMTDWRSRSNVEPWMLFNLCYALRHLGRYAEANEITDFTVQKWGFRQQEGADMRLFLAVEKALAGATAEAAEELKRVHVRDGVAYDRQLKAIARSLVDFQQSPSESRAREFKTVKEQLGRVFPTGKTFSAERDVRRTLRRAATVFAQKGAGSEARAWFFWKLNWQWSLLPLAPLAIAILALFPPFLGVIIVVGLVRLAQKK